MTYVNLRACSIRNLLPCLCVGRGRSWLGFWRRCVEIALFFVSETTSWLRFLNVGQNIGLTGAWSRYSLSAPHIVVFCTAPPCICFECCDDAFCPLLGESRHVSRVFCGSQWRSACEGKRLQFVRQCPHEHHFCYQSPRVRLVAEHANRLDPDVPVYHNVVNVSRSDICFCLPPTL